MNCTGRRGFTMLLALAVLATVSSAVLIFANISGTMLHQERTAHAEADARNLTLSAIAWAHLNAGEQGVSQLDVGSLGVSEGAVSVSVAEDGPQPVVQVSLSCNRGQMRINRTADYELPSW